MFKIIRKILNRIRNSIFIKSNGHVTIFQFWLCNTTKQISLINFKNSWSKNGTGRIFRIRDNGGRRKNGDSCYDFFIEFGYLSFNYTNFALTKTS